jgi:hypothetical protein
VRLGQRPGHQQVEVRGDQMRDRLPAISTERGME